MAELKRSDTTFRRFGSSGLVWDESFLSEDGNQNQTEPNRGSSEFRELRPSRSISSSVLSGLGHKDGKHLRHSRTMKQSLISRDAPANGLPSPKSPSCFRCVAFTKPGPADYS